MTVKELADIISSLYIIQTQMRIASNVTVEMNGQTVATIDPRALTALADAISGVAVRLGELLPDEEVALEEAK